jgi:hypothetical protein
MVLENNGVVCFVPSPVAHAPTNSEVAARTDRWCIAGTFHAMRRSEIMLGVNQSRTTLQKYGASCLKHCIEYEDTQTV